MSEGEIEQARVAREAVELGEELFALALSGYARREDEEESEDAEAYPLEEIREAAEVFFRVLRGLLDVEGSERE